MNMLNQKQRQAIQTLQEAHGAVLGMMNYLQSDAPTWVAENARQVVEENIAACKVTRLLIEDEECENTYIMPLPTARVYGALKVLIENAGECESVDIVKEWLKSEAEQAVWQAMVGMLATGDAFPPQIQWAVDELKKMKEGQP